MFAFDLDRELALRGFQTAICALVPADDPCGIDVPTLGRRRLGVDTLYRLRREVRTRDLVLGHGSSTLPACVLATTGLSTPFVYRSIGDPVYWATTSMRHRRTGLLLRQPDVVVALWPGAVEPLVECFGLDERRIRVIPNAVRADRFSPASPAERVRARACLDLPGDASVVAYLGALSPEKDVGLAIEAIAAIPDAVLAIAGEGAERAALERAAAERAPGRVRFLGAQRDARRVAFAAADTVVLPSRTEGIPAALIEAGLSELPVVATDVGGVSEVVLDGETGVLVPPGELDVLVEALRTVLGQPRGLGAAARSRCLERFDVQDVAARWAAVLSEAMALERV